MSGESTVIVGSRLNSILTAFVAVLAVGLIIVAYFTWKSLRDENQLLRNEIVESKKLTKTLIRGSTKWATKEDVVLALGGLVTKEDLKTIQNDLNSLGSRLSAVGQTVGSIKARIAKLEASDSEGPENPVATSSDGKIIDIHGYTKKPQIKELEDSNKAPLANVQFDASKDKPWSYEAYRRDYKIVTVVGKKDDGQLTFHQQLQYYVPDKNKDKIYNVELLSSKYLQVPLKNQMFWFNPILDVNVFVGGNIHPFGNWSGRPDSIFSFGADIGLSFSSYGETKADSWFRLFRLGVGYDAERRVGHFSFAPFAFNIGKPLPLLTNLYLTPQIAIDTAGGLILGLGIGPSF
ncbi:MAG: hypothetical protein WC516_04860 [Patescibacteria group bacterium]